MVLSISDNYMPLRGEIHLHYEVVKAIRKRYGATLMLVVQGGELQDTKAKRISMWKKGYVGSQPDIMITNPHGTYGGLCIELKNPRGTGTLSNNQIDVLSRYRKMGWKIIVSNDLKDILSSLEEYVEGLIEICLICRDKLKSPDALKLYTLLCH